MNGEPFDPAPSAQRKIAELRRRITALTDAQIKQKAHTAREAARADNAERLVRDTSRELQRWKDRAKRAEATIASAGLTKPGDGKSR